MNITSPESEWPSLNSKGWSSVQSLSRARLCDSNISVLYNSNANHAKLSFLVQLLSHVQLFGTPWTAACEASLSIITPKACSSSCPSSWWCHPTISSSVVPFSFPLQSFPASGSFLIGHLFLSGSQSIGLWASASVLPMSIHGYLL